MHVFAKELENEYRQIIQKNEPEIEKKIAQVLKHNQNIKKHQDHFSINIRMNDEDIKQFKSSSPGKINRKIKEFFNLKKFLNKS